MRAAGWRWRGGDCADGGPDDPLPVARRPEEAHSRRDDEGQQRAEGADHQGDQKTWQTYVHVGDQDWVFMHAEMVVDRPQAY